MFKKIIIIVFLFTSLYAYSQEIDSTEQNDFCNLFTNSIVHKATFSVEATNHKNFNAYKLGTFGQIEVDMKELYSNSGIYLYKNGFGFGNDIHYAPTFFDVLNLGVRVINHFDLFYKEFYDYNCLFGVYTNYSPFSFLSFSLSILYQVKVSHIFQIQKTKKRLISTCPALDFLVKYMPTDFFTLYFTLSSFTFNKYDLFFAPIFNITGEYELNKNYFISLGGEIQYVDFFTLSANFSRFTAFIKFSWRF